MDFGSWSSIYASSSADVAATITFWKPLMLMILIPIFVIGGIFLVVKLFLRLVHGKDS